MKKLNQGARIAGNWRIIYKKYRLLCMRSKKMGPGLHSPPENA
jgi:hypothetical protein